MATNTRRARRSFGKIRQLPSGRHQASYIGPDMVRHVAPDTFDTRTDADAWLARNHADISREQWRRPEPVRRVELFTTYAETWLAGRELAPRTRVEYRRMLEARLVPEFGSMRLDAITPARVRDWYGRLSESAGPTRRAHCYALLRTILNTAATDDLITANPCRIRGAGQSKRARKINPLTLAELETVAEKMRAEYRAAVLLAAWCGLRFGELAELRRKDIDLKRGLVSITRAVGVVDGEFHVGPPKSEAGVREVHYPADLGPILRAHLAEHVPADRDALLFPAPGGGWLRTDGALHRDFHASRVKAGRPDARVHDLRHFGATLAAAAGATTAELMARIGHTTPQMAMRYQAATADRDRAIAHALNGIRTAGVVELRPRTATG